MDVILSFIVALFLVPVAVLTIEIGAAVWGRKILIGATGTRTTVAILIPAHNEEGGISATLRSIVPQLNDLDRLIVVADNCTDRTATIAHSEGAEVISRSNLDARGKGFALDFGIRHLKSNPPDIVIVVDADCQVGANAIDQLAKLCSKHRRPVQAQYLMRNQENAHLKLRIAEFAWVIKNLVRPLGLAKLGLPCQLMGSGMAFPWDVIHMANLANAHIVEDMKMGLDFARRGVAPMFCPNALVVSFFPTQERGIQDQRTRWEHGHLGIIVDEAPSAFWQGLKTMDLALVVMALDLCIPPIALLGMLISGLWLLTGIFFAMTANRTPLLIISCASLTLGLTVMVAWASHGRRIVSFANLLAASIYPLRKIPLYVRFVFSRQSEWVRSKRDDDN